MAAEVIMPKVDMDMTAGKITVWHVDEGGWVNKGDVIFEIETDKAAMEVESEAEGFLHFRLDEGNEVPIGAPVAWLFAKGEEVEGPVTSPENLAEVVTVEKFEAPPNTAFYSIESIEGQRATPKARKLARDTGIDLTTVAGTGPRGRVQAMDIEGHSANEPLSSETTEGPLANNHSKVGEGDQIVLLHGFASDALSWRLVESVLENHNIIRIELPGHGKSPKLGLRDFADLVSHVQKAFDALATDRVHLVGHSLGGAIALALVDSRPENVASLTLFAPACLGPEVNGDVLQCICRANEAKSLEPWLKLLVHDESLITERYVRLTLRSREDPVLRAAQLSYANILFSGGIQAFDLRAELVRVKVPTKIIWGKNDQVIPWQHALQASGNMALHLFEDIGHMPHIEAAAAVGKLIADNVEKGI